MSFYVLYVLMLLLTDLNIHKVFHNILQLCLLTLKLSPLLGLSVSSSWLQRMWHNLTSSVFLQNNSVAFSMFIELCYYHHHLISEHHSHSSPQPWALIPHTHSVLSIWGLPTLDISYKKHHMCYLLCPVFYLAWHWLLIYVYERQS